MEQSERSGYRLSGGAGGEPFASRCDGTPWPVSIPSSTQGRCIFKFNSEGRQKKQWNETREERSVGLRHAYTVRIQQLQVLNPTHIHLRIHVTQYHSRHVSLSNTQKGRADVASTIRRLSTIRHTRGTTQRNHSTPAHPTNTSIHIRRTWSGGRTRHLFSFSSQKHTHTSYALGRNRTVHRRLHRALLHA